MDESDVVERLKGDVLSDLVWADDLGLWEPLWTLNTWFPNADKKDREAVAEQVVRELHEAGLITLYRSPWAAEREKNPQPLPGDEVEAQLQASWWRELPLRSGDIWMAPTDEAERFANRSLKPS